MGKNRNGPSDLSFGFNVAAHTFPEPDEDGDPITAPVAEPYGRGCTTPPSDS